MRLLVDELPFYGDDCMFGDPRWGENKGIWITYCKFTNEKCDLDLNERGCSFLKEQDK